MTTRHTRSRARGFSLVEVMVALVVTCVGLLGVAKMQALSLSNTTISRQRSIAAIEAASLAAAMRANRLYWSTTAPDFLMTWNPNLAPAFASVRDPVLAAAAIAGGTGHGCDGLAGVNAACAYTTNAQALAAADLAGWGTAMKAILPNPTATVACGIPVGTALPPSCVINITWGESSVAMSAQEATSEAAAPGAAKFERPNYQLYVEP